MALIIKSLGVDPPNYDELSDDEDDFVKDPAQYRAVLPQPYRFVDELLSLFLDEVWEDITLRVNERAAEQSKIRPPKYECAVQMQELCTAKALAASNDGRYLFVAAIGCLSVLDASKRKILHTCEADHLDLISLTCTVIGVGVYLLTAVDDQGVCHVFGCTSEKVFPMKVLNEELVDKYHIIKCQPSLEGDYLGLVSENPSTSEVLLEIYNLPRDAWLKEIEDIRPKLHQSEESKQPEIIQQMEEDVTNGEVEPASTNENEAEISGRLSTDSLLTKYHQKASKRRPVRSHSTLPVKQLQLSRQLPVIKSSQSSSGSSVNLTRFQQRCPSTKLLPKKAPRVLSKGRRKRKAGSKKEVTYKFTAANCVMRQRNPDKLQANLGISPSAALKDLSDPKLILGSGHGHLLTRPYLEIRHEAFDELHSDKVKYKLTKNEGVSEHVECHFHFFTSGLAIPYGIEQPGALKKTTSIGVWWSGSSQFIFYSLTRPVKVKKNVADTQDAASRRVKVKLPVPNQPNTDQLLTPRQLELDIKPETVWPQAAVITASATSPDSSLVVLGLENGLVTVWDKYLCCVRKTLRVSTSAVASLDLMDPSICPQSNNRFQSYPTSTSCYVLVRCSDSSLFLLNCGPLDLSSPICIAQPSTEDDNIITAVDVFPSKCPEIILKVFKNGTMFLQDVISMKTLCEISLPSTHELTTPWQPVLSVSAFGQMLYLKGTEKAEDDEIGDKTSLFVFQFRSFPALDDYWTKFRPSINFLAMSPIETRVSALLTQRVKSSEARQQRLQQRWPLMKQEALKIQQIKSH